MKKTAITAAILLVASVSIAANVVTYTSSAWSEASASGEEFRVYLRDADENGDPVTGNDRVFVQYRLKVTGDDGSAKLVNVERQLVDVPNSVWTGAEKTLLWELIKQGHAAARAVATAD